MQIKKRILLVTTCAALAFCAPSASASNILDLKSPLSVAGATIGSKTWAQSPTILTSPVPEPASWAMLLTGFSVLGMAIRRNRGSTVRPSHSG